MVWPYLSLGVNEDATDVEIRQAYLDKVRQYPPEKSAIVFQQIAESYALIKNEEARARMKLFGLGQEVANLADLAPEQLISRPHIPMELWLDSLRQEDYK